MIKKIFLILFVFLLVGCEKDGLVDIQSDYSGIHIINNTPHAIYVHILEERYAGLQFTPICQDPILPGDDVQLPIDRLEPDENTFVEVTWWHEKVKDGSMICNDLEFHTVQIPVHSLTTPSANDLDSYYDEENMHDQGF